MGQEIGARKEQQDDLGITVGYHKKAPVLLAVLADGMGGMHDGAKFSRMAVSSHLTLLQSKLDEYDSPSDVLLSLAFHAVNQVLENQNEDNPGGTTLISALIENDCLSFLSIGDSRIYLFRNNHLLQINREHTFGLMLDQNAWMGKISFEDAECNIYRDALNSSVGSEKPRLIDFSEKPIHFLPGDKLILMSDGIYRTISDAELENALTSDPEKAKDIILKRIKEKSCAHQDNNSIVIVEKKT